MMTLADLYNFYHVSTHAHTNLGPLFDPKETMSFSAPSSSSFCHTELQRSLKEQKFGIKAFSMVCSASAHQATASVSLLEGQIIIVQLTTQGFSV
ncbi:hypothetical protein B0H34DRAFT_708435 [Crassisporium funariophilum]|nr:hypothetical protein B0H34DRAFT_708435 [Crassisporium funariophilum]